MFRIELSPNLLLLHFPFHFPLPIPLLRDISPPVHHSYRLLYPRQQHLLFSLHPCSMRVILTIHPTKRTSHLHLYLSLPTSSIRLVPQRRCQLARYAVVEEEPKIDSLGWRESRSSSLSLRSKTNSQARRWIARHAAKIDLQNLLLEGVRWSEGPMPEQSQRGKEQIQSELKVSSLENHSQLGQQLRGKAPIRI